MVKNKSTFLLLFKKLIRSVKSNYKQFLAIIAISFLAICLFSGLTANAENFADRVNTLYTESNFADIYVTTDSTTNVNFDELKKVEGINEVEKRSYFPIKSDKSSLNLICQNDSNNLSRPLIQEGEEGFLVMKSYADTFDIKVGDEKSFTISNYFNNDNFKIYLDILSNFVLSGKTDIMRNNELTFTTKVSGIMLHPEGVQSSAFSSSIISSTYTYLTNSFVKVMSENYAIDSISAYLNTVTGYNFNFNQYSYMLLSSTTNQILVKAKNNVDIYSLNEKVKDFISNQKNTKLLVSTTSDNLPCSLALNQDVTQAKKLTYVFPIFFFLVSVLVILTTISQMIMKERIQIGSLKAVGVSKTQIYLHYVSYGFVLCLIGGIIGFFVGPLLIPNVMEIKYKLLWDIPYKKPGFFYLMSILITALLLLLSAVVSFSVSHSVISEKPVDTLRSSSPKISMRKRAKESKVAKYFSIPTRMAYRNIMRSKVKSIMVILGTLGCTSLLVSGFGIMDTLNYGIELSYKQQLRRDINITTATYSEEDFNSLSSIDGVKRVEKVLFYPVSAYAGDYFKDTTITLMEKDSLCFSLSYGDGGVVVDKTTADNMNLKVGDEIKIEIQNNEITRKVDSIFESSLLHGFYDINTDYLKFNIEPTSYWITLDDVNRENEIEKYIKNNYSFVSVLSSNSTEAYANDLLGSIRNMTDVIKIFAILLAVVVIYNLTSMNINERSRDIATMKVLGFNYKEITKTLITEIMIDTFIGAVLGLGVGYPMCVLILAINKTSLLTFVYHIEWYTYIISLAISLFTAMAVNLLLCLRTKKIKMVESLKSME